MALKLSLTLLCVHMLAGCSSICLINEAPGAEKIPVLVRSSGYFQKWGEANDQKLQSCAAHKTHYYSQGPVLADYIPSFEFSVKPSCLLKKAKNEALSDSNGMVVEDFYFHFEAELQYRATAYGCPEGVQFEVAEDMQPFDGQEAN
ncbi:hypothetical protein [Ottowia sp.]|uniref:hypothetical protein n=1 Tax=Ottowia sp. TaxID=1898956 RepID=UPI003A89836C